MIDFQKVRDLAKSTLNKSQDIVSINYGLIDTVLLPKIESNHMSSASKQVFVKNEKDESWELGLNIFFNVVNFCFKDPETGKEYIYHTKNEKGILRSTGLFAAMSESSIDWSKFQEVAKLSKIKWLEIIQFSKSNPLYLAARRQVRLNRLANYLLETKNSSPELLLQNSDYQADILVEILVRSGLFKDDFLKRVQVSVHAIDSVLCRRRSKGLENIDKLTCMADYRIPQVFYNLGVINIGKKLKEKLVKNQSIEPESKEELALRSTVIIIGNLIAKRMNVSEVDVDLLLWNLSQDMSSKGELPIPHMLVATDKY